jgi:hypothetical protein
MARSFLANIRKKLARDGKNYLLIIVFTLYRKNKEKDHHRV